MATTTKPAARNPAAKRKPAAKSTAARKEAAGEQPVADFHGLKITLPAKLPASFALRLGKLQRTPEEEGAGAMYGFLADLIGEQQLDAVMDKMDETGEDFNDSFNDLLTALTAPYGAKPGESIASGNS